MTQTFRTPDTLNVNEVAQRLGIGRSLAYELARRGEIPGSFRLGGRLLIKRGVFEQWIATDVPHPMSGADS